MNGLKQNTVFFDRSYGYARAVVALIGGLILVIWPEQVKNYCMYILGTLILLVGIVNIILYYTGKWKTEKTSLLMLNSIVDIAFGLVLLIFPSFFVDLIMFVFGLILLVFGSGDIVNLVRTTKVATIPRTVFIGPALIVILGVAMFFFPNKAGNWLFILFGAGLLIYAVSESASTYIIRKQVKDIKEITAEAETTETTTDTDDTVEK